MQYDINGTGSVGNMTSSMDTLILNFALCVYGYLALNGPRRSYDQLLGDFCAMYPSEQSLFASVSTILKIRRVAIPRFRFWSCSFPNANYIYLFTHITNGRFYWLRDKISLYCSQRSGRERTRKVRWSWVAWRSTNKGKKERARDAFICWLRMRLSLSKITARSGG